VIKKIFKMNTLFEDCINRNKDTKLVEINQDADAAQRKFLEKMTSLEN